jgi:hypothetical protein
MSDLIIGLKSDLKTGLATFRRAPLQQQKKLFYSDYSRFSQGLCLVNLIELLSSIRSVLNSHLQISLSTDEIADITPESVNCKRTIQVKETTDVASLITMGELNWPHHASRHAT